MIISSYTNLPISLGSDVKSLIGTGIFFTIYSQMTSMLYFSWADMGMIGAPSAIVPNSRHNNHIINEFLRLLGTTYSLLSHNF